MDAKQRIMIIDDEPDLTHMIGFQFTAKGFEVLTAHDGLEALSKVHAFKPDLIILDVNMPRMGGIEFYGKIVGPDGRPLYPVLVLTARANIQGLFKDLAIDGFMIKPFEIDDLVGEAELIIKKRLDKNTKGQEKAGPRRVIIVEHEEAKVPIIASLFLNADYSVSLAKKGAQGIEKIMQDVPDVALVQLGLPDIAGDIVVGKLIQMARTMGVKFVLYTPRTKEHHEEVMKRLGSKTGVLVWVEYTDPHELLDAVNKLF